MRMIILFIALLGILSCGADNTLRGKRLKVGNPARISNVRTDKQPYDTVYAPESGQIVLSGYDKPLNSMREAMLVTNHTGHDIASLCVRIKYTDLEGRQLHTATVNLDKDIIPCGSTLRVDFPSWDIQRSYYYHLGKKPRTANVTPYRVHCDIIYYTFAKND